MWHYNWKTKIILFAKNHWEILVRTILVCALYSIKYVMCNASVFYYLYKVKQSILYLFSIGSISQFNLQWWMQLCWVSLCQMSHWLLRPAMKAGVKTCFQSKNPFWSLSICNSTSETISFNEMSIWQTDFQLGTAFFKYTNILKYQTGNLHLN